MADDNWYYAQNNQQLGPVTLEALRGMVASGQVGAADLVWTQGMAQWLPARSVAEVASALPGGGGGTGGAGGTAMPTMSQSPGQPGGYMPPPPGGAGAYPPGAYYGGPPVANQSGRANTALGLGIASLPLCLCPFVGIGLGIAAIVVGKGVAEGPDKSRARTGIICGTIGVVLGIINAIAGVVMHFSNVGGGRGF